MITFHRVANGIFEVLLDGVRTDHTIINGSLGLGGRGQNMYGIKKVSTGETRWIGSLERCKKAVTLFYTKEAR